MKIVKYPLKIKGEIYTEEVKFSLCEYDILLIQIDLYKRVRKRGQKPEFTFRKRVPIETYIHEAEYEMKLTEEVYGN